MIRLQRFERIAYRLALFLMLVAAARFGWVLARQQWRQQRTEKPSAAIREHNELPAVADLQRQLALASPGAFESALAADCACSQPRSFSGYSFTLPSITWPRPTPPI